MLRYFCFILLVSVAASATGSPLVTKLSDWPTIVSIELSPLKDNGLKNEITLVAYYGQGTKSLKVKAGYPSFNFELPNDPIVREYYLKYIRCIERSGSLWKVTLTNGQSFRALWLTTPVIYSHESSGFESFCYYSNKDEGKAQSIATFGLRSLQIKTSTNWVSPFSKEILIGCKNVGSVVVHLRNGQTISAKKAFLSDYCGEWSSTSVRTRWLNAKETYVGYRAATLDENASSPSKGREVSGTVINPLTVKRIVLTGEFSKLWSACRKVVVEYRDGKTKKTNLLLTSESYGGLDIATGIIGREWDALGVLTDYGRWYVPLNEIKSIDYRP